MIQPESRNLEWIEKAAKDNNASNPILVEKVIRAFSLLEALARSGCPFVRERLQFDPLLIAATRPM